MKIVYTSHLEFRLKFRNIPHGLPEDVFRKSKERYYDIATRHYVAVYKVEFEGKIRDMALTYDKRKYAAEMITIHPIKTYQKTSRINSGRWKKI